MYLLYIFFLHSLCLCQINETIKDLMGFLSRKIKLHARNYDVKKKCDYLNSKDKEKKR